MNNIWEEQKNLGNCKSGLDKPTILTMSSGKLFQGSRSEGVNESALVVVGCWSTEECNDTITTFTVLNNIRPSMRLMLCILGLRDIMDDS